ncbi:unnamed protein product [Linum tenue]|uniref:DUF4283 domain-containing protein n=1 Tax=Linum tenue TaxID=586396 RepID=A0AAV0MC81_9ROSI|nr:unnamed protein product [Linum tenue]
MIVWILFPAMPIQYYHSQILTSIGNALGRLIKIDYHSESMQRARFARIVVELDLSQPLRTQFKLDGVDQDILYENLPLVFFSCGRIGHKAVDFSSAPPPPPPTASTTPKPSTPPAPSRSSSS